MLHQVAVKWIKIFPLQAPAIHLWILIWHQNWTLVIERHLCLCFACKASCPASTKIHTMATHCRGHDRWSCFQTHPPRAIQHCGMDFWCSRWIFWHFSWKRNQYWAQKKNTVYLSRYHVSPPPIFKLTKKHHRFFQGYFNCSRLRSFSELVDTTADGHRHCYHSRHMDIWINIESKKQLH